MNAGVILAIAAVACLLVVGIVVVVLVSTGVLGGKGSLLTLDDEEAPGRPDKQYNTIGNPPPRDDWMDTPLLLVGEILARVSGTDDAAIEAAMKQCHSSPTATHIQVNPNGGYIVIKNANKIPAEAYQGTHKCQDGRMGSGGGTTYIHPRRGWGDYAKNILETIDDLECKAGSMCHRQKVSKIMDIVGWITTGLSGALVLVGGGIPAVITRALDIALETAEFAADMAGVGLMVSVGTDVMRRAGKKCWPYANHAWVKYDVWEVGEANDNRDPERNDAYTVWHSLMQEWDKKPELEDNYVGVNFLEQYRNVRDWGIMQTAYSKRVKRRLPKRRRRAKASKPRPKSRRRPARRQRRAT